MAPGGPWLSIRTSSSPNGATATHLVTSLIFRIFLQRNIVLLCSTDTDVAGCLWRNRVWDLANWVLGFGELGFGI